jgi:hypothetical protein
MSTVRWSCETLALHGYPRLTETSRCRPQPSWRALQQSTPRCVLSSAVPATALCARSIAYCCVPPAASPRRLRPSCFARARGSRLVRAYRAGSVGVCIAPDGQRAIVVQSTLLLPCLTRPLSALLHQAPRAYGWGRPRWRCATLALTRQAQQGRSVSAAPDSPSLATVRGS